MSGKHWGTVWGAPFVREDGVIVLMRRKAQRVRFYTQNDEQVGPEHSNVAPAFVWAIAQGWTDTLAPGWLMAGMRAEVAAKTTYHHRENAFHGMPRNEWDRYGTQS